MFHMLLLRGTVYHTCSRTAGIAVIVACDTGTWICVE